MNVTFADFGPSLASSRLRAAIPQRELKKLGIHRGLDVLVYGKHWLSSEEILPFRKKIYDVCDDHFDNAHGHYYRKHIAEADVVTCNSEVMRVIIKQRTGRDAVVIPEPYESDEQEPSIGPNLLWYGHQSNLPDLTRIQSRLRHPLTVLSNNTIPPWSPESFEQEISRPCIVIIPTGKSLAKSENRMVEAIRNGKYVCAEHLPSYEQFGQFFPLGDIPSHIEQVLENPEQAVQKVKMAQSYINTRFSPQTIAKMWLEVIENVHQ